MIVGLGEPWPDAGPLPPPIAVVVATVGLLLVGYIIWRQSR